MIIINYSSPIRRLYMITHACAINCCCGEVCASVSYTITYLLQFQTLIQSYHVDDLTHWGRDDIFKCFFLNENVWISIEVSLKFVPKGPLNNIPALDQIMAWRRPGDKPLSEPMVVRFPTLICVTRPQWVNAKENASAMKLRLFFIKPSTCDVTYFLNNFNNTFVHFKHIEHIFNKQNVECVKMGSSHQRMLLKMVSDKIVILAFCEITELIFSNKVTSCNKCMLHRLW